MVLWLSKYTLVVQVDYFLNIFPKVYSQQFLGTVLSMVGLTSRVFTKKTSTPLTRDFSGSLYYKPLFAAAPGYL